MNYFGPTESWLKDIVKGEARYRGDSVIGGIQRGGREPDKEGTSYHKILEGKGFSVA
jgi:hypothetical protein